MKHFLLKFNHGVEIGAANAYFGHFQRTLDGQIFTIAMEEVMHESTLREILEFYGHKPNPIFDKIFDIVGTIIGFLCLISPEFLLDHVARIMEKFAISNYKKLSDMYPEHAGTLMEMHDKELAHEKYFTERRRNNSH